MSRLPPALLYLTIYNPTLRPTGPIAPDDEDAEEEAQILFYTARERAVSRDTMLRQVGLAKALNNFSEIFSHGAPCENVHSQTRRMAMVAPEPDFWIHACVELAKTPRRAMSSKKAKGKGKVADKDKAKEDEVLYDYHDGSVHDVSLRSQLLRGYEQFKLIHGSFSSVLDHLGQQALELQLERFFTVWAWRWDIEQDSDFGSHLGLSLHPLYKSLTPALDEFASQIPDTEDPRAFALIPPHFVPSTSFTTSNDLHSLPLYLRSRIPPPRLPSPPTPLPDDFEPAADARHDPEGFIHEEVRHVLTASSSALLALGSTMDVRKWSWPGYLTIPKGLGTKPTTPDSQAAEDAVVGEEPAEDAKEDDSVPRLSLPNEGLPVQVDTESLFEAMSSISVNSVSQDNGRAEDGEVYTSTPVDDTEETCADQTPVATAPVTTAQGQSDSDGPKTAMPTDNAVQAPSPVPPSSTTSPHLSPRPPFSRLASSASSVKAPPALPAFAPLSIYVSPRHAPHASERRTALYLFHEQHALAFVARAHRAYDAAEMDGLRAAAAAFFACAQSRVAAAAQKRADDVRVTAILQPKDKYIIATGRGTVRASAGFASRSEHLYTAQQLISTPDVAEVFSRTQGPQHWVVAKREAHGAAVYMEVARKETTLTDVENELEMLMRRYAEEGEGELAGA